MITIPLAYLLRVSSVYGFQNIYFDHLSVYKHIILCIGKDYSQTERTIEFLDTLPEAIFNQILVIHDRKGSIGFIWKDTVPDEYKDGESINMPDGDVWAIIESFSVKESPQNSLLKMDDF